VRRERSAAARRDRHRRRDLPAAASDIHYLTRNGSVEVTFPSHRIPDHPHRAGILPEGLCGTSLRGPVWEYRSTAANGTPVDVIVERSVLSDDAFRRPARAAVTFTS